MKLFFLTIISVLLFYNSVFSQNGSCGGGTNYNNWGNYNKKDSGWNKNDSGWYNFNDSVQILNYSIHLSITNFYFKSISGYCNVTLTPKTDSVNQITLALLNMDVDTILLNGNPQFFWYINDSLLIINLFTPLNKGDTDVVTVYYNGMPEEDPTGAGGFYFNYNNAFNLGTGRGVVPHCFGRDWYPCVDEFSQRATYDFHITTDSGFRASCNGYLTGVDTNFNHTLTWNWKLDNTIPTYLANVAVGQYATLASTYYGANGDSIPILLTAIPSDTANVKTAFIHLPNAISTFENHYGPYRWNKIGYVFVPFTYYYNGGLYTGAVEEATNIAYGEDLLANGATTYETRMAHELSHHWFGDLITCSTEQDMWMNEGWAQFSEKLFLEDVYGEGSYLAAVKANHITALQFAHVNDDSFRAVSPMPDEYTYGSTVYDVGSDAAHTLRSYMGDSLFFHCLQNYFRDSAFTAQSSYSFRDYLANCSGINLTDFFNDYIFNPGFEHFSIDSVKSYPNGNNYNVTVYIRQRLDNAPQYYNNVPLDITFMDAAFDSITAQLTVSGVCTQYNVSLPFNPVFTGLNINDRIGEAVTDQYQNIKAPGIYDFSANTFMKVTVTSVGADSALFRIEHNWVLPDAMKTPIKNLHLSDYHYWKVDGTFDSTFSASAIITYNGTTSTTNGYLDNTLITNSEDSLVVMYRPGTWADWKIDSNTVLNTEGNIYDKKGYFTINNLQKGEYTLAIYDHNKVDTFKTYVPDSCEFITGITLAVTKPVNFSIYPNPTQSSVTINCSALTSGAVIECYSSLGNLIYSQPLSPGESNLLVQTQTWAPGVYIIRLQQNNQITAYKKLVVIH